MAYEPVWAIGTGRNATAAQAGEAHAHIRGRLGEWFGAEAADRCHVIYGGSVKPDNIRELIASPTSTARSSAARASTSPSFADDRDRQPAGCGIIDCFLNLVIWSSSYLVIDWSIAQPIPQSPIND